MNISENNIYSIFSIILDAIKIFYFNKKKQFYLLFITIFLGSLAEVISFSLVIPVIYIINDPSPIQNVFLLNFIYTNFHFSSTNTFILFLLVTLVIVFLIKNLFLLYCIFIQHKFVYSVANDILRTQMTNFYKNDYLDVKEKNSIDYFRCLIEAPHGFADSLVMPMIFLFNEFLVLIIVFFALLFYKPSVVFLLFISIFPIGYWFITKAKHKLHENSDLRSNYEKLSYINAIEGINAYSDIKLFSKENSFINSILDSFNALYKVMSLRSIYILIPRRVIEVLVILTICVIFIIANMLLNVTKNEMVLILLTFSTAAYRLLPSLNEIVINIVKIRTSSYILELLNFIKAPIKHNTDFKLLSFNNNIQLKNIIFSYKSNNIKVLDNLSLCIQKGEFVVLTGDSGVGKSTIGKILTGFVKADAGQYLIDNIDLQHINQIKKNISYVTQDFYLFDKTLWENIAIGETIDKVDLNKINQIIKYSKLKEFVDTLPHGIYQPIGEMGTKLSGGQKQRIAIARALYRDIEFLVLDEATSSLDKENEQDIINTLYDISKEKNITVLLITHRVIAVNNYDAVYELKNGILIKKV